MITTDKAIEIFNEPNRIGGYQVFSNDEAAAIYNEESREAILLALDALLFVNKLKNKKFVVEALAQLDDKVLNTALMYSRVLVEDSIDISERWDTAVEQVTALNEAYNRGFYEGQKSVLDSSKSTESEK